MKVSMAHEDFRALLRFANAIDELHPWLEQTEYLHRIARIEDWCVTLDDSLAWWQPYQPPPTLH